LATEFLLSSTSKCDCNCDFGEGGDESCDALLEQRSLLPKDSIDAIILTDDGFQMISSKVMGENLVLLLEIGLTECFVPTDSVVVSEYTESKELSDSVELLRVG
jgi:hypothetical protein